MGSCFSTTKVSGSNSNTPSAAGTNSGAQHHQNRKGFGKASTSGHNTSVTTKQEGLHYKGKGSNKNHTQQKKAEQVKRPGSRRQSGVIPCGKRTDFGYDKDFDRRFTIGKLLGHGQFGYTYAATDKFNGDRVAVKRIEKSKVFFFFSFIAYLFYLSGFVSFCSGREIVTVFFDFCYG